jgi:methylated-DNA-[protein]-cysteine S-methyltransferase
MKAIMFNTRLGWAGAAADDGGITDVLLPREDKEDVLRRLDVLAGSGYLSSAELERLKSDMVRYFRGEPRDFSGYLLNPKNSTFFRGRVWEAARMIPYGGTATYGEMAAKAGRPGSSRAVGGALNANPIPLIIPCHRVVSAGGIGGFASGADLKRKMLELERGR